MLASAKCGEWQMALKLFDSLFRAGLSPDVRTYSSAILACFKGQQVSLTLTLALTRLLVSLTLNFYRTLSCYTFAHFVSRTHNCYASLIGSK